MGMTAEEGRMGMTAEEGRMSIGCLAQLSG